MSARRTLVSMGALALLTLTAQGAAFATELKILASRAVVTVLEKVGPQFEKDTGHKLRVTMGLSSELVARINANEAFDVIAVPPAVLDGLIAKGKAAAGSKMLLMRSANAVLVRAGAAKPDVSSVDAFKRALLNAKSIGYLPVPGVPQLIEKLGLKETLAARTTIPNTDTVADLVAKGEVELAITGITQAYTVPGVALAGPLPAEVQFYVPFGGAVSASSQAPDAARALLTFLKSAAAVRVIKEQGMEPL